MGGLRISDGSVGTPGGARINRRSLVFLLVAMALGLAVRLWLNIRSQWLIDGDEALFGIGAVRLLHGQFPNLLYGVPYMGMLQSYIAAPFVALLGPTPMALRCVTLLAATAFIAVTWLLTLAWYGPTAAPVAAVLAAVPSVYFDAVGLKVWGSYVGVMVLGDLLLLGAWHSRRLGGRLPRWQWLLLGLGAGLALWANLLVASYPVTALLLLPWRKCWRWLPQALEGGLPGLLLGGAPLWWYNLRRPAATFRWLFVGAGGPGTDHGAIAHVLVTTLLPRVVGITSPWGAVPRLLAVPLGVLTSAALLLAIADTVRPALGRRGPHRPSDGGRRPGRPSPATAWPLLLFLAITIAVYLVSGFGGPSLSPFDASGRYVLPVWTALPVLLAALCVRLAAVWRPAAYLALALVLAADAGGHVTSDPRLVFQSPYWDRLPLNSRPLVAWLRANHVQDVWLNHWAGDPLMYLSGETVRSADYYDIIVGHGINRFPATYDLVNRAPRAAFVLVVGALPPPPLGQRLQALGVTYREATVGAYAIYLPLSRRVDPSEVANELRYPY
jgi:hypothetical protein